MKVAMKGAAKTVLKPKGTGILKNDPKKKTGTPAPGAAKNGDPKKKTPAPKPKNTAAKNTVRGYDQCFVCKYSRK